MPALLDEASASVRAFMRCVPDPVPDDVVLVVSRMVKRALDASVAQTVPQHVEQFARTAGPFSQSGTFTEGSTSGSPWMTKDDKRILRGLGCRSRVWSFDTR